MATSSTTYNDGLYTPWTSTTAVQSTTSTAATTSILSSVTSPAATTSSVSTAMSSSSSSSSSLLVQSTTASALPSTSSSSKITTSPLTSTRPSSTSALPLSTPSVATSEAGSTGNSALSSSQSSHEKSGFKTAYLSPVFILIGLIVAFFLGRWLWRRRSNKREWWPNNDIDGGNDEYIYGDMAEKNQYHHGWAQYDEPYGGGQHQQYNRGAYYGGEDDAAGGNYDDNERHGDWSIHAHDYAGYGGAWDQGNGQMMQSPLWIQPDFPPESTVGGHSHYSASDGGAHGGFRRSQMPYLGGSDYSRVMDRDLPPLPSGSEEEAEQYLSNNRQSYSHTQVPTEEPVSDYDAAYAPDARDLTHSDHSSELPYQMQGWSKHHREDVDQFADNGTAPSSALEQPPARQPKSVLRNSSNVPMRRGTSERSHLTPRFGDKSPAISEAASSAYEPGTSAASIILGYMDATPTLGEGERRDYLQNGPMTQRANSIARPAKEERKLVLSNPDVHSPSSEEVEEIASIYSSPSGKIGRPDGFGGVIFDTPPQPEIKKLAPESEPKSPTLQRQAPQSPPIGTPKNQVIRSKRSFASPVLDKYTFHVNSGQQSRKDSSVVSNQNADPFRSPARQANDARESASPDRQGRDDIRHRRDASFLDITNEIDDALKNVNSSRSDFADDESAHSPKRQSRPLPLPMAPASPADANRRQTWREGSNGRWTRVYENNVPGTSLAPPPRAQLSNLYSSQQQRTSRSEVGTSSSHRNSILGASKFSPQQYRRTVAEHSPSAAAARKDQHHSRSGSSYIADIPDEDLTNLATSPSRKAPMGTRPLRVGSNRSAASAYSQY